jgi:hypothetical protein
MTWAEPGENPLSALRTPFHSISRPGSLAVCSSTQVKHSRGRCVFFFSIFSTPPNENWDSTLHVSLLGVSIPLYRLWFGTLKTGLCYGTAVRALASHVTSCTALFFPLLHALSAYTEWDMRRKCHTKLPPSRSRHLADAKLNDAESRRHNIGHGRYILYLSQFIISIRSAIWIFCAEYESKV